MSELSSVLIKTGPIFEICISVIIICMNTVMILQIKNVSYPFLSKTYLSFYFLWRNIQPRRIFIRISAYYIVLIPAPISHMSITIPCLSFN